MGRLLRQGLVRRARLLASIAASDCPADEGTARTVREPRNWFYGIKKCPVLLAVAASAVAADECRNFSQFGVVGVLGACMGDPVLWLSGYRGTGE